MTIIIIIIIILIIIIITINNHKKLLYQITKCLGDVFYLLTIFIPKSIQTDINIGIEIHGLFDTVWYYMDSGHHFDTSDTSLILNGQWTSFWYWFDIAKENSFIMVWHHFDTQNLDNSVFDSVLILS